jgi:putative aminopeptidase FrvX
LLEWFQWRGAGTDKLLVLDTSPYPDRETAEAQDVVLRHRDTHARFAARTVKRLERVCARRGISWTYKDDYIQQLNKERAANDEPERSIGSTELGRVIKASRGEVKGATLQVPTTGYHTPWETASLQSVIAMLEVLKEVSLD